MKDTFQTHLVEAASDVAPFAMWLMEHTRQDSPIALVLRDRKRQLCFATRDDAWLIDMRAAAGPLAAGVLRTQLLDQNQLKFHTRHLAPDLRDLCRFLAPILGVEPLDIFAVLAPAIVGDLTAAAHCVNQEVTPPGKFRRIEHDAYEVALLLPQYEHGICRYYGKVGVPLGKVVAEGQLGGKKAPEWFVTYEHLWLRVFAYWTGDPILGWAFTGDRDPWEALASSLKRPREELEVLLRWQACGRDLMCFTQRFANRVRDLPDDLGALGDEFDRRLPNISWSCRQMMQSYVDTRNAETLYGRRLRPGKLVGEAVAFRVFGTVEEIISNAAVTFWNQRPSRDMLIENFEGGPDADVIRVNGFGPREGKHQWAENLRQLAPLANPLGSLPLKPRVTLL